MKMAHVIDIAKPHSPDTLKRRLKKAFRFSFFRLQIFLPGLNIFLDNIINCLFLISF